MRCVGDLNIFYAGRPITARLPRGVAAFLDSRSTSSDPSLVRLRDAMQPQNLHLAPNSPLRDLDNLCLGPSLATLRSCVPSARMVRTLYGTLPMKDIATAFSASVNHAILGIVEMRIFSYDKPWASIEHHLTVIKRVSRWTHHPILPGPLASRARLEIVTTTR